VGDIKPWSSVDGGVRAYLPVEQPRKRGFGKRILALCVERDLVYCMGLRAFSRRNVCFGDFSRLLQISVEFTDIFSIFADVNIKKGYMDLEMESPWISLDFPGIPMICYDILDILRFSCLCSSPI